VAFAGWSLGDVLPCAGPRRGELMADALQNRIDGKWVDDLRGPATVVPGYKPSGIRRELGKEGVEDFLEKKSVYLSLS
jgi:hypothetical protein